MTDVTVLGAGAFGTALALHCSDLGHRTRVWAYDEGLPEEVAAKGENATYLPGFPVPPDVLFTNDMAAALQDANLVLLVVPSGFMRSVTKQAAPHLPRGALITSTAKGIEQDSLALMSEVLAETLPDHAQSATYLSGPSFAKDIASRLPADVSLAAADIDTARQVQAILHAPLLRVYASDDVIGVQLGGALKNVIAVACGAAFGLGLGASALASLMHLLGPRRRRRSDPHLPWRALAKPSAGSTAGEWQNRARGRCIPEGRSGGLSHGSRGSRAGGTGGGRDADLRGRLPRVP
jgi:glycerol-3-phosphate dehydrogenase (NAD(P)+)